jgi:hypothetical protein
MTPAIRASHSSDAAAHLLKSRTVGGFYWTKAIKASPIGVESPDSFGASREILSVNNCRRAGSLARKRVVGNFSLCAGKTGV